MRLPGPVLDLLRRRCGRWAKALPHVRRRGKLHRHPHSNRCVRPDELDELQREGRRRAPDIGLRDARLHDPSLRGPTATFTDAATTGGLSDFSATIDWGDGSSTTGTISGGPGTAPYTVHGSHIYATTGFFTVSGPGNSASPPDGPLPTYMGGIVTSSDSKSGSAISGDILHIVVVKTNAGYAPNPGHDAKGKDVAEVCQASAGSRESEGGSGDHSHLLRALERLRDLGPGLPDQLDPAF